MKASNFVSDNKSKILTGAAVGGVLTTTGLAIKAAPKASREIEYLECSNDRELTLKEKVKATWKFFVPTAASAVVTIGCVLTAEYCNEKDKALAMTAAAAFSAALTDYKEAVVETVGEELGDEVKKAAAQKELDRKPFTKDSSYGTYDEEDVLCYEPLTGRYFRSTPNKIDAAMNEVCRELIGWDEVNLNSLFSRIGLEETELGEVMGWRATVSNLPRVTYSANLTDDRRTVIWLDYTVCPCLL